MNSMSCCWTILNEVKKSNHLIWKIYCFFFLSLESLILQIFIYCIIHIFPVSFGRRALCMYLFGWRKSQQPESCKWESEAILYCNSNIMGNSVGLSSRHEGIIEAGKCCRFSNPPYTVLTYHQRLFRAPLWLWIICGVGIQIQEFQNEFSSTKFAWSFVKAASAAGPVQFLKDKCLSSWKKLMVFYALEFWDEMRVST